MHVIHDFQPQPLPKWKECVGFLHVGEVERRGNEFYYRKINRSGEELHVGEELWES